MTEAQKLHDDIFYGRIRMCDRCRRKKESNCTNRECLIECERMVKKKVDTEQLKLF